MACPYYSRVYHESRPFQGPSDLIRAIGERHRDARMVDDLLELPPGRHAQRGEEPRRAPRRDCENHTFRLVCRSAGHGEPAARGWRREGGDPLVRAHGAAQGGDERLDEVRHAAREALEPLSELALPGDLDPEQLGRAPLAHHDARHVHPRSAAAFRTRPESASTSSGSSFRDAVRSSWTSSRAASARYVTSTSYRISTWSHTNPNGTMRNAR